MDSVRRAGFEFFPSRITMDRVQDLNELLASAEQVKALLVGGSRFVEYRPAGMRNLDKAILPDPRSSSLSEYSASVNDSPGLSNKILQTTSFLVEHQISVRWYPEMVHHAILIADAHLDTGWAQYESVLPFGELSARPGVAVKNPEFQELVSSLDRNFEAMWARSTTPDLYPRVVPAGPREAVDDHVPEAAISEISALIERVKHDVFPLPIPNELKVSTPVES